MNVITEIQPKSRLDGWWQPAAILLIAITIFFAIRWGVADAQPVTDPWIFRHENSINGDLITIEIYEDSLEDIRTRQFTNGNEDFDRLATSEEIAIYQEQRAERSSSLNKEASKFQLTSDPELAESWLNWVNNRSAELDDCQATNQNILATLAPTNWDSISNGQRTAVIEHFATCSELHDRLTRKTIRYLYDILVANDFLIIEQ